MHDNAINNLVGRSAFIRERQDRELFVVKEKNEEAMKIWKDYSSGHTREDVFIKSLEFDGMEEHLLDSSFVNVSPASLETLKSKSNFTWVEIIEDLMLMEKMTLPSIKNDLSISEQDIPGDHIVLFFCLTPFYRYAYRKISEYCLKNQHPITRDAMTAFSTQLFYRMEPLASDVFLVAAKRHFQDSKLEAEFRKSWTTRMNDFVEWIINEGLRDIFIVYPAFARLSATILEQYISNACLLLSRLCDDRHDVIDRFLDGKSEYFEVTHLKGNLSDSHNNGQSVVEIGFSNGKKIIYKPRSLLVDATWNLFVRQLCDMGLDFDFKEIATLLRDGYGYAEYILWDIISDVKSINRYYYNSGALLCIVSMLGGSDFHYENIIAHGTSPVLVDLETIITARSKSAYEGDYAQRNIMDTTSVGRTLMLQRWVGSSLEHSREIGGISSTNTEGKNYHLLNGKPTSADQYIDDVLRGYDTTYTFIMNNRNKILSTNGVIHQFGTCKFRYVFRRTALYNTLQRHFYNAKFLRDSLTFEAVCSRLGAGVLLSFKEQDARALWSIVRSEKEALYQIDIPYFVCDGSGTELLDQKGCLVENFLEIAPVEMAKFNLRGMSSILRRRELEYITKNLKLSGYQRETGFSTPLLSYQDVDRKRCSIFCGNNSFFESELTELIDIINGYRIGENNLEYYAPVRNRQTTRYNLDVLPNELYGGALGMMVFNAAVAKWTSNHELKTQVSLQINTLCDVFYSSPTSPNDALLNLGFSQGIAGIMQTLRLLSFFLNDDSLLDAALGIALSVGNDFIERASETDLFGGIAGYVYISSLLAKKFNNNDQLLDRIETSCRIMLGRRKFTAEFDNIRLWHTQSEHQPLTGLAHGHSGYAVALLHAWQASANPAYKDAARQILDYESLCCDSSTNNWYDYRVFQVERRDSSPTDLYSSRFMSGYCSGAPGIGLGRIIANEIAPSSELETELNRAIRYCIESPIVGNDSLCCGSAGWIDFLLEAAAHKQDDRLIEQAKRIACAISPTGSGKSYILSNMKDLYDISLFKGLAGIGYQYMRLLDPNGFPSLIR